MSDFEDLTIIGYQDWCYAEDHGLNHRDLHLTVELAKHPHVRRVLFVSRPVSLAEQIFRGKRWKSKSANIIDSGFGFRLYEIDASRKLYVLSTWVPDLISPILLGRLWWNRVFRKKRILRQIALSKKRLEITDGILMLCTPFAVSVIEKIPYKFLIFDVIDNFAKHLQLRESERRFCARAYTEIDAKANLITCVSTESTLIFKNETSKVMIRNGVDKSWMTMTPPKPPELAKFKNRIVGFGGTFTKKFNGNFLSDVARIMPDVEFVLMGKVLDHEFQKPFSALKNVHYIGFRDFLALPAY
jgi:hypothetical protein